MPADKQLVPISNSPGVQRDGTDFDTDAWIDSQWVRFQRGRPKKMGGYRQVVNNVTAPVRAVMSWSRQTLNALYSFSTSKAEMVLVDSNGVGNDIVDRTPVGFTANDNYIWTVTTMFDAAAGSNKTLVLAHASQSMANIDDNTLTDVYSGDSAGTAALTATGITASGGVCVAGPYAIYYGSDGNVTWSNANEPLNITTGDAGSDRATGAKIVKGLPVVSGSGPAALLWSLDSLIKMDYVGGQAIFRFSTVTDQSSILAQNSVIEYDGAFFWCGVDRFLVYDGGSVSEVPNSFNLNWFFDNLNYNARQKIWASKTPRYGEIEWFYPRGTATECTDSVIFNIREKCWYDRNLARSAGYYSQVFRYPVMSDAVTTAVKRFTVTVSSGAFQVTDTITGPTGFGTILKSVGAGPSTLYVQVVSGVFLNTDSVTSNSGGAGTIASAPADDLLASLYVHEVGYDAVIGEDVYAIPAHCTTSDVGLTSGGPQAQVQTPGINNWMTIERIEPDFILIGSLTLTVGTRKFAQKAIIEGTKVYTITNDTDKIDMRENFREAYLRFDTNELGGFFEMGRVLIHAEASDDRS
jgi:hypothetical protein